MVDNTWETRYTKAINNKYRDFNIGNDDATYEICNIFCNFKVTQLDKEDYIKGITATSSNNILHINPLVDTDPPQKGLQAVGVNTGETKTREKKVYIKYGFNNGIMKTYELIDIFIQSPSKAVLAGKRYQMETCLLFSTDERDIFLVVCIPMEASTINTTDDPLQKNRYTILTAIANDFPSKGKTYSIQNAPNWDPRVFLPIKNEDNSSFYTWNDPTTNNTVMYIQFEHPIKVPYKFFETFANTLSGSVKIANEATTLAPQKEHADINIYYNENRSNSDIRTVQKCEEKTFPEIPELITTNKLENNQNKDSKKNNVKENTEGSCKTSNTISYVILFFVILIFCILVFYFRHKIFNFIYNKIYSNSTTTQTKIN